MPKSPLPAVGSLASLLLGAGAFVSLHLRPKLRHNPKTGSVGQTVVYEWKP